MPHVNKQMISFFLTTKCNLRCVYCYNVKERESHQEKTLPLKIAKAGINHFFKNNSSRHIRFYGPGEPTQEFHLMENITNYARDIAEGTLSVEIQTNGVFDHNVRSWLLDNVNILWISFDGEPDIQNSNRPIKGGLPSSPIIEDNVKWLNSNSSDRKLMIGARVTMTNNNIFRQNELIDYFFNLGIKHIWTDPVFPGVDKVPKNLGKAKKINCSFDIDSYIEKFIEAHRYAERFNVFYGSFLACNFDGETIYHCRACTPVPHLTPDGYVSACDLVTFGEEANHMDCFVYGKYDDATDSFIFDSKKIQTLRNRNINNMSHCLKCEARLHCGGYCLGEVTNETGDMYGQKTKTCKAIRRLFKELGKSNSPYKFLHP